MFTCSLKQAAYVQAGYTLICITLVEQVSG